uniref:Uncharacterized protein n=1 Tax=Biomphalaria glabrata TaxID=6526 RepID=A0A2C9KP49_BIOGL
MRFLSALLCLTVLVNTMESSPVAPDGYEPPVGGRAVRGGIFDIPTQVTIGEPSSTNVVVPNGDITPVDGSFKPAVGGRAVRGGILDIPTQVTIGEPTNNTVAPNDDIIAVGISVKV